MTVNAMWWVNYTDLKTGRDGMISLMSPDYAKSTHKGHVKARQTAKARLAKKGIKKIKIVRSRCVG